MLDEEQTETVLISTVPEATGHERIVVAFREGDELYIPLDAGRPANQELLDAEQIYIREIDDQRQYAVYEVHDHRVITPLDRQRLEAVVGKPISVTTEVLHVTGTHRSVGRLVTPDQGFVVVIDGSERALRALDPAVKLAQWHGRPLGVCAVTAGPDDRDTLRAVALQLEGTAIDDRDVSFVAKVDLEAYLFEQMRQGHILVASAFGVWTIDGRLHGMLNGLVRHNAPAIIGIGPNVAPTWEPGAHGPVVLCVDHTEHAHELVDQIEPFISPPRGPVRVVHVTTEDPPDTTIADQVAGELHRRYGLPVEADHVPGTSAAEAISTFASTVGAQLVIVNSWHRPSAETPTVASTSVTSVAHVECPVAILCAPSVD